MASVPSGRRRPANGLTAAPFDELLTEVLARVSDARDEQVRWRLLLDAVVTLGAGHSLDDLLGRIVEVAGDLVGARYAALGVLGSGEGRRLRLFVTRGLDDQQISTIGDFPEGHGVLGVLIDRPEPVRLHDIAQHPDSFGFPPNHPPMHSFLGVPVRTGERVFGNLYLTEKLNGDDFTEQDEAIAIALASAAGVAIENAQLHDEAARRERWLDARGEIARALLGDLDRAAALQLIADRAREIGEADLAWIVTGPHPELLRVEVVSGMDIGRDVLETSPLRKSVASAALQAGTPMRIENLAEVGEGGSAAAVFDVSLIGPAVMVPLSGLVGDEPVGLLALGWHHGNQAHARFDLAVATAFAEQCALALRLARSREDRERVAVYDDRERIGRDLHDVVIQRLFAIGLRLQGSLKWTDRPELRERLDEVVDEVDETIREIRRTIFELGSAEAEGAEDIQSQVTAIVERAAASLKFRPSLTFEGPVRLRVSQHLGKDVVAVLGEALSNVSRHAKASRVAVELAAGDELVLRVSDDGVGIAEDVVESGLSNLRQRAVARNGRLELAPGECGGTVLEWAVPLG